jgi:hypothetical protein
MFFDNLEPVVVMDGVFPMGEYEEQRKASVWAPISSDHKTIADSFFAFFSMAGHN